MSLYHLCKATIGAAFPLMCANLISTAIGFTSMYLLSLTGYDGLAAGGLISSTYAFFITTAFSLLLPIAILVSQSNVPSEIKKVIHHGLIYSVLISIPIICILQLIYPILIFFKQPQPIVKIVGEYFKIISYGILPTLFNMVLSQFLVGISRSRIIFYFSCLAFFIFILLSYIFLNGCLGIPKLGAKSIAYGVAITSWISFFISLIYLKIDKELQHYKIFPIQIHLSKSLMKNLFSIGWPICIQNGTEIFAVMVMTYLIGSIGQSALAAQQITLQCTVIPIMIVAGLSQATTVLIGRASNVSFKAANEQYRTSIFLVVIFNIFLLIIFLFFPKPLISIFLHNTDTINYSTVSIAIVLLAIAGVTRIFDGIRNITLSALRACKDVHFSLVVSLLSYWVIAIPLSNILIFNYGAAGVRLGFLIGILFCAISFIFRFKNISNNLQVKNKDFNLFESAKLRIL